MDEHTLKLIEFDKVLELVASLAPLELARQRVLALRPSPDAEAVGRAQELTAEMVAAIERQGLPPFGEIRDVRTALRRAKAEAMLAADTLRDVASTLRGLSQLRGYLSRLGPDFPGLSRCADGIYDAAHVARDIEAGVDRRGQVVDSASRELLRLRHEMRKLDQRIRQHLRGLIRSEAVRKFLRYPNFTVSGSHYVLPVCREHRHQVPGVLHRTSASGETVFIEPAEVAELSTELGVLGSHESREVKRVLRQLSAAVGRYASPLLDSLETAAELACICAKARYARQYGMTRPELSAGGELWLASARHPLLEYLHRSGSQGAEIGRPTARAVAAGSGRRRRPPQPVVPIDVRVGGDFDLLLLTGPNTGGKTVALKTTGLLAAMAQSGLHIPAAEGSRLPVFDQILADIGDEQSIEQSLSTFSAHIGRIGSILVRATSRSLVLLDELGAGTDPAEGAALGRAILDELLERRARSLVTTHLGDLKMYALSHPRAQNAAVLFDTQTLRPTYQVRIGDTGQSCALVVARRLALGQALVDRAERYFAEGGSDRAGELASLEQLRAEAERARAAAWQAEQEAGRVKRAYEQRLQELARRAADHAELQKFRRGLQPGQTVYVSRFRRPATVVRVDRRRGRAVVQHGSMQWELPLEEIEPPGDAS